MASLYLVRHGQASFGAADYDRLSELGHRQCHRLGAHLRGRGVQIGPCFSGTLRRQRQSLDSIADGFGGLAEPRRLPGLDEVNGEAVVRALFAEPPPPPDDPARAFRHHFRLLRDGLTAWMEDRTRPAGVAAYADFAAAVAAALALASTAADDEGGDVLMVSSGGPIAIAVGIVLGLAPAKVVELNMRIRNSAVTEFEVRPGRRMLIGFNSIAHLEHGVGADWITYA